MPRRIELGDLVDPMGADLLGLVIERQPGVGQVVEQGFEPLVIKRQPMLHADIAAPGADRFVERIIGASSPEFLAIALAEAADCRVVEQNLADRAQYRFLLGAGRALGQRVKAADALDRVAKKVEPQWLRGAGRVEIDDAAADRELAGLAHRVGAEIAVVAKEALQPVAADLARWPQDQHPAFE